MTETKTPERRPPGELHNTDSLGFLDAVAGLPEQLIAAHDAAAAALSADALPAAADIHNIVVLGMGGSGISGDVLASVANGTPSRCRSRC